MNSPILKILAGIALISIILASGAVILRTLVVPEPASNSEPDPTDKPQVIDDKKDPGKPQIVNAGPPPVLIKKPVAVAPDHPLQPAYRPVNQPEYLQFLRKEGKIYHHRIAGKVGGRASKKDWGIRGVAYFQYLYAVESKGKILSNDGIKIVEERSFGHVHENLMVSAYEIGIELPQKLDSFLTLLSFFGPKAKLAADAGRTLTRIANNVRVPIPGTWVEQARQSGLFTALPQVDPGQFVKEIRMFSQGTDNRLLEGKKVRIHFIDGKGIEQIEPIDCALSVREHDLIIRTNFVMDHYIFPDRKVEPGNDWEVDGDVFSSFLDPRMNGKVEGKVTIQRTPDFLTAQGEVSRRLKIMRGQLILRNNSGGSREITAQVNGLRGICLIPDKLGVVTSGRLQGYADYKNLSKDHLLFAAETTFTPKIEISYECSVE